MPGTWTVILLSGDGNGRIASGPREWKVAVVFRGPGEQPKTVGEVLFDLSRKGMNGRSE